MSNLLEPFANLKAVIQHLAPLSESEWKSFSEQFTLRTVPARTLLLAEGDVANEIFFIHSGLLRLFYVNQDNDQITAFLFSERMFASSLESLLQQAPSLQVLETIEPCTLLVLTGEGLTRLYDLVPVTHVIMRKVLEQRFIASQRLLSSYILASPQKRYEQFSSEFPELIQRVPQNIIASFLGVTPVSLSRIRKRISKS